MVARALLLAAVLALAPAAHAAEPDAAHDFPCGTAAVPAAALKVCERTTGEQGMTPKLVANRRGTLFMTVATKEAHVNVPGALVGEANTFMLRSRDDGRSWTKVKLPRGVIASEGILHLDEPTDRLFALSMSYDLTSCGYPVAWTDDEGESWHAAERRPGCVPYTVGDWPKLFTGPPPKGVALTGGFPRAIYSCNFVPNILVAASLWCWSSFDGGRTFGRGSMLPVANGACVATDGRTTVHGKGPETIVHGTGEVLADGTVVIPVTVCGRIIVVRSTDGARTWAVHDTGSDGTGWLNWLQNLDTQTGADNVYNMMLQQEIAQDDRGNLFLPYPATGGLKLAVSRDGGLTWQQRGVISTNEVAVPWVVSTAARGDGQVAVAYLATRDKGEPILGGGERFQSWIGYSADALHEGFAMAPTSPLAQPALVAGGIAGQSISCCATLQYFIEYTGIAWKGRNELRAAFVRDRGDPNPILTLGKATLDFRDHVVGVRVDRARIRAGRSVRLSGRVTPVAPGASVALQTRRDRAWTTIATARLARAGTYALRTKPARGVQRFRVVKPESDTVDAGVSRTVKVTVTRRAARAARPRRPR